MLEQHNININSEGLGSHLVIAIGLFKVKVKAR